MAKVPKPILAILLLVSLVGAVIALAAIVLAAIAIAGGGAPLQMWFTMGFEVTVLLACVFGILGGLERFRAAPGMMMLFVGSTVFVAATLAEPVLVNRIMRNSGNFMSLSGVKLVMLTAAQMAVGGVIIGLAGLTVILRRPRVSLPYLVRGVLLGLPLIIVGGLYVATPLGSALAGAHPVVRAAIALFGFIVLGALFAASIHNLIRGFEVNMDEPLTGEPEGGSASGG